MGLKLFRNCRRSGCVSENRFLSPAIVSGNDGIALLGIGVFIQNLSKLIHTHSSTNQLAIQISVTVLIGGKPSKRRWVVISEIISTESIPMARNSKSLNKM